MDKPFMDLSDVCAEIAELLAPYGTPPAYLEQAPIAFFKMLVCIRAMDNEIKRLRELVPTNVEAMRPKNK